MPVKIKHRQLKQIQWVDYENYFHNYLNNDLYETLQLKDLYELYNRISGTELLQATLEKDAAIDALNKHPDLFRIEYSEKNTKKKINEGANRLSDAGLLDNARVVSSQKNTISKASKKNDKRVLAQTLGDVKTVKPFIFVSHSSKDSDIVNVFVDKILKLTLKIDTEDIFYTSLHETSIKSGDDFRMAIKNNLLKASIVIQIISANYRASEVCLNEMGAAWVLNNKVIPFILPPINYNSVGFIHSPNQIRKLNIQDDIIAFIEEEKGGDNKVKTNEIIRHTKEFVDFVEGKVSNVNIPKLSEKSNQVVTTNELGLQDGDIVKMERREETYLYQDEKLVKICDNSSISMFIYGLDASNIKILKVNEARSFVDDSKEIPILKRCKIIVDRDTNKKWLLVNQERRFLPPGSYLYLVKQNSSILIDMLEYSEISKFTEGDMLFDVKDKYENI